MKEEPGLSSCSQRDLHVRVTARRSFGDIVKNRISARISSGRCTKREVETVVLQVSGLSNGSGEPREHPSRAFFSEGSFGDWRAEFMCGELVMSGCPGAFNVADLSGSSLYVPILFDTASEVLCKCVLHIGGGGT